MSRKKQYHSPKPDGIFTHKIDNQTIKVAQDTESWWQNQLTVIDYLRGLPQV